MVMPEAQVSENPAPVQEAPAIPALETAAPVCPKCEAVMVKRQAAKGPHAGKFFWACSAYPKCRQVVAIGEN
jgi:ssDNA-binding Zn-finger/Zn-ribbon topoisomerase 1